MADNDLNIKTFDDVYKAVGVIIELAQDLERYYKQCAELIDFETDKLDEGVLNRINGVLYSYNNITKQDLDTLQNAKKEYDYLIHEFFWDSSISGDVELIERRLNSIYNSICLSCDVLEKVVQDFNKSYHYF